MKFYGSRIVYEDKPCWLTRHWMPVGTIFFVLGALGISLFTFFFNFPNIVPAFLADTGMVVIINLGEASLVIGIVMWGVYRLKL